MYMIYAVIFSSVKSWLLGAQLSSQRHRPGLASSDSQSRSMKLRRTPRRLPVDLIYRLTKLNDGVCRKLGVPRQTLYEPTAHAGYQSPIRETRESDSLN